MGQELLCQACHQVLLYRGVGRAAHAGGVVGRASDEQVGALAEGRHRRDAGGVGAPEGRDLRQADAVELAHGRGDADRLL